MTSNKTALISALKVGDIPSFTFPMGQTGAVPPFKRASNRVSSCQGPTRESWGKQGLFPRLSEKSCCTESRVYSSSPLASIRGIVGPQERSVLAPCWWKALDSNFTSYFPPRSEQALKQALSRTIYKESHGSPGSFVAVPLQSDVCLHFFHHSYHFKLNS